MTETTPSPIRVLIIDDHPILRRGLTLVINQEADLRVCGEAEDSSSAVKTIEETQPDIVLVDISLKDINGIELIKVLLKRWPHLPILVLSRHPESIYAERAIRAGARGYIMKEESTDLFLTAIRKVIGGELYLSEAIEKSILKKRIEPAKDEAFSQLSELSDRELEVFQLIGQGWQPRQIADRLNLSVKTVETYRTNIRLKLHLKSATDLIQFAIQWSRSTE